VPDDPNVARSGLMADAALPLFVASVVDYAMFMLDPRGHVATWNAGAERIKGYRAEDIVGHHFSRFYPEEDVRAGKPAMELEVAAREGRFEDEGWRLRKDGSRFWANVVITAMRDDAGQLVGFGKVTRDLTERRRAEEERHALALRAARALDQLTELAIALADARTTDQVVQVVIDRSMAIAAADAGLLYMLEDEVAALRLAGHRGVAPDVVERVRWLTESTGPGVFSTMRTGVSVWAVTAADFAQLFPGLAQLTASGSHMQAFWAAPLMVEGRAIGLFAMAFHRERDFPLEERALADTLAKQCAQALLRAKRLESEQRTQAWIATTLRSIGDAVIATDTAGCVTFMNAVAERLTGWPEGDARGRPLPEVFDILTEETRTPCENPVTRVLREGAVVGLANHTLLRSRQGRAVPIDDSAAPIREPGGALVGVVLVFRDASAEKRDLVRRDFLVRAGATLASSLDYRATLATVARLAVPQLADWCSVDILEPGAR
jgi:PAS domain S-box-containing protein